MAHDKSSGIIPRVYKSGSIIYFEGDKSEYIYVQKSGRVILTSINLETGEEIKEEVRNGEFFGVKSAIGKYPREETAQTVGETVVLLFQLADFERMVLSNVNVVQKMLRVFSNQLRRIGKTVRTVLGEDEIVNVDEELFKIGEYYYTSGEHHHAQYVFKKYMEYYPDTEKAAKAMARIKSISTGEAVAEDTEPEEETGGDASEDFMESEEPVNKKYDSSESIFDTMPESAPGEKTELSNEMENFLDNIDSDGIGLDELDGLDSDSDSIKGKYNSGVKLFNSADYSGAMEIFRKIISAQGLAGQDRVFAEKAEFELGRCQVEAGQKKEAVMTYMGFIKKYPKSDIIKKVLINIGEVFETVNQNDKAKTYYAKAASIMPRDQYNEKAEKKIKQL